MKLFQHNKQLFRCNNRYLQQTKRNNTMNSRTISNKSSFFISAIILNTFTLVYPPHRLHSHHSMYSYYRGIE